MGRSDKVSLWYVAFLYFTESSPPSFKARGLQMTMNLALV